MKQQERHKHQPKHHHQLQHQHQQQHSYQYSIQDNQHQNNQDKNYSNQPQKHQYSALKYSKSNTIKTQQYKGDKLHIQTDYKFLKSLEQICHSKNTMLSDIISLKDNVLADLECQKIHALGLLHRQANIINNLSKYNQSHLASNQNLKVNYCNSGCDRFKGLPFSLNCNIDEINVLGSSIVVYFMLLKQFIYTLLLFILIYAIFSITVNLIGHQNPNLKLQPCESSYCTFRNQISASNKSDYNRMMRIEGYLSLFGMFVLILCMRLIKYIGTQKDKSIDSNLISSSDYAIKINNLPYGEFHQVQLYQYLEKICLKIEAKSKLAMIGTQHNSHQIEEKSIHQQPRQPQQPQQHKIESSQPPNKDITLYPLQPTIESTNPPQNIISDLKSIQIIYNMKFSRQLITKISYSCLLLNEMIKKKDHLNIIKNKDDYLTKKKQLIQSYQLFQDLRKKFLNDGKFRKNMSTRTAIVEFYSQKTKNLILKLYGKEKISLFKQLKLRLMNKCFGSNSQLIFKGNIPQIIRAPQPSDLLWENCQQKESITRILVIYMVTFFIILLSFGLILGLQYVQINFVNNVFASSSNIETILNIAISTALQIINKALWLSLFYLLNLQYNHTSTNKIISHMHKASFLMWINIILLPIFVQYVISKTYFGGKGLSGIIFDYHISALSVSLIMKLIDPADFMIRLCLSIKCIRNYLVRIYYKKIGGQEFPNKAKMNQIYLLYEGPQFNIAESYVFIISNILHAFFFCSLQPFILILVLLQVFFFYWICKVRILRVNKIPSMTQFLIFQVSVYQLMLIPVFYGAGRLFHNYVYSSIDQSKDMEYVIGSICIFIGLLNYFNPGNIVQNLFLKILNCCKCCCELTFLKASSTSSKINSQVTTILQKEQVQHRLQDYFKESNSLCMLGFQKFLRGQKQLQQIEIELKRFCSNCIPNKTAQLVTEQFQLLGNLYDSTNHLNAFQKSKGLENILVNFT